MSERGMGPFECAKPMSDQVTPERLYAAQTRLAEFASYKPPTITTSWLLAEQLVGVSDAVSDVVLARGSIATFDLTGTPGYDSRAIPPVLPQNAFEKFYEEDDAPAPELAGRLLMATPTRHIGATLSLQKASGSERELVCEVIFPTSEQLAAVAACPAQEWSDLVSRSIDLRTGREAYPFHFDLSTDTAPLEYLLLAKELSGYLLESTSLARV